MSAVLFDGWCGRPGHGKAVRVGEIHGNITF